MAPPISAIAEHSLMSRWRLWTWVLVLVGFFPILAWHVAGLLSRPHYQFVVFIPLAWWMIWQMWSVDASSVDAASVDIAERSSGRRWIAAFACLTFAFACLGFATWRWSPWFAAVGGLIASFGLVVLSREGRVMGNRWFAIWLSCWILLPLPFGLDEDLIVQLRTLTTRVSSSVMDELGLLHHSYANVIELPSRSLFIADACSGIHSLYVLMAVAFFIAILLKRSVVHALLLLLSTFGLVLIENVTRIVTVGLALRRGHDWSEGTSHTVLGAVLFALSAILVLSADQFFLFLLPERKSPGTAGVNQFDQSRHQRTERLNQVNGPDTAKQPPYAVWFTALACLFPPLAIVQMVRAPETPKLVNPFSSDLALPSLTDDALPTELLGFVRYGHDTLTRVPGDPFGKASQRWLYRKGSATMSISLDYPYDGVKDMCPCYEATGWEIEDRKLIAEKSSGAPFGRATMKRELFGSGVVLFSSFDLKGNTKALIKELVKPTAGQQMINRIAAAESEGQAEGSQPPYIQVQLFARDHRPFEVAEIEELQQIYRDAQERLMTQVLSKTRK